MFNGHLLKHNLLQLIIAAAIAILIYIYAVAQGFTLPMQFGAKPQTQVLSQSTSKPTPTPKSIISPSPSRGEGKGEGENFSTLNSQLSTQTPVLPAAAAFHASEKAQEVANVPLRLAEMTNEGGAHAIENTQEALTTIATKTVKNLEEKIKLKENF